MLSVKRFLVGGENFGERNMLRADLKTEEFGVPKFSPNQVQLSRERIDVAVTFTFTAPRKLSLKQHLKVDNSYANQNSMGLLFL